MVITVQCTSCSTSFPVDPGKVPAGGVHARCSECGGVFRVERPEEEAVAPAPAPSPETPGEEPPDFGTGTGIGIEPEAPTEFAEPAEAPADEEAATSGAFAAPPEEAPPQISSEEAATEVSDEDFVIEQETLYAEPDTSGEPPAAEAPPAAADEPARQPSVSFGQRDPKEKAARLARVLVSDMILYNPQRHTKAIESGNLAEEFEDEIKKSWEEYVEQVGPDIAESTPYFTNALNEILAKGEEIF